jgi:AraC family transcriptional regulator of adaptative response/methylated-DNA-[protein]-cysteine methyltransferase
MTFHAFERARRLGVALGRLHQGDDLLAAGYDAGYASPSGFRDAFEKLFGRTPGRAADATLVKVTRLGTPLGAMVAAATDDALCLLEFADRRMLETQIDRLQTRLPGRFVPGDNDILARTQVQIAEYFAGTRRAFDLPLVTPGTEFQRAVWGALRTIPYGATRSYADQARAIDRPAAVRAVGRANGDNRIAIIVPCHRVVGASGVLVGYGGQLWRKKALLALECDAT